MDYFNIVEWVQVHLALSWVVSFMYNTPALVIILYEVVKLEQPCPISLFFLQKQTS